MVRPVGRIHPGDLIMKEKVACHTLSGSWQFRTFLWKTQIRRKMNARRTADAV
jgi:hypothetical protein